MGISLDDVRALKETLEDEHRERHDDHRQLRQFWHGRHWDLADAQTRSLSNLFRDLANSQTDVGPDFKMVHNIVQSVCVKFQTFLSPLPMIRVYTDPPESNPRKAQATLKERVLYSLWNDVRMSSVLNSAAWYLPLMGDCFLGIHPDFDRNMPVPVLRSPEYAYPVVSFDGRGLDSIIFCWEIRESVAKRTFPDYVPGKRKRRNVLLKGKGGGHDPMVEVLEFSDDKEIVRWVDGQRVAGVEHGYGFNLYEQLSFIHVPDEPWNHGAVEQTVGMNLMHDALLSLLFQAVMDNVFPLTVIEDAAKLPEELQKGPGAVWPVNPGGKVEFLSPPVQALATQVGFMENNVRSMQEASHMPPVNFGQSPASSIVTGKAINELQGAGSGSVVEMVQGNGIGLGISSWNSKALYMFQTIFREDRVKLGGMIPTSIYDRVGRMSSLSFKGSEIVGSQRNEVVFSPALAQHEKLVMGLQALGGRIVSKKYVAEQIGIPDYSAMQEEIVGEAMDDAVLGAIVQSLQSDPSEQNAAKVEDRAFAYMQGATPPADQGAGAPGSPLMLQNLPAPAAPGPAQLGGALPAPAGGPPAPPAGAEVPPSQGGPPQPIGAAGQQGPQTVTVDQVAQAVQGAQVTGRVFIVGELAQRGQTEGDIELAVTEPADRDPVAQALGALRARTTFHVVPGEPSEPHLEVTPGTAPTPGGGAPGGGPPGLAPEPALPGQGPPVVAGVTQ